MRIILFSVLLFSFIHPALAQADTSYQLLWYLGKKIRPNVLLTPKGDTIVYTPSKGTIKVTSGRKSTGKKMDNMLAELNKTPKRMQEMLDRFAGKVPKTALPSISDNIRIAFSDVDRDYRDILSNVIALPDTKMGVKMPAAGKGGYADEEQWTDVWDDFSKEVRDYIANHYQETFPNLPEPPRYDFTYCYECNDQAQEAYKKQVEKFIADVAGAGDTKMLQRALTASREAHFFFGEDHPRNRFVQKEAFLVIDFIIKRLQFKATKLIDRYIDDPERAVPVLQIALTTDRHQQLMGIGDPLRPDYGERAFAGFAIRMERALNEKDYSIGLNLQLFLSTSRQMQLLGASTHLDLLDKAMKFNQFKMNMNISAKVSGDEGYQLAHLRGDNWFMAYPDSNCHLKWFLIGPYMNKVKMDLIAAELKSSRGEVPYVGTKNWEAPIPNIKLDFCNYETDSVIAYPFNAENFVELWHIPNHGPMNLTQCSGVLLACFMDIERTKKDAAELQKGKVEQMQKEMAAKYESFMKIYKTGAIDRVKDGKNLDIVTMNAVARSQEVSKDISELIYSINPGRYIFKPVVHNKESVIVIDKINGKEIFPENTATEYAWFHIRLEHDPGGPYAIHL